MRDQNHQANPKELQTRRQYKSYRGVVPFTRDRPSKKRADGTRPQQRENMDACHQNTFAIDDLKPFRNDDSKRDIGEPRKKRHTISKLVNDS